MAPSKPKPAPHATPQDSTKAVDAFMARLDHACKAEIQELRRVILGADPAIAEGIKWNSPSFRTTEYFATVHLREKAGFSVILHLGAKVRDASRSTVIVEDPQKMLNWLAKDRARVAFKDKADFEARRPAFANLIRSWIAHV
jgi:hypothetical protein